MLVTSVLIIKKTMSTKIGKGYIVISTLLSVLVIVLIFSVLLINSWDAISVKGWQLLSLKWNPSTNQFGIMSMLFGTLVVTLIALFIAVPIGILTAIFTSEILHNRYRLVAKSLLELLAGIPSIIYGLIGVAVFSIWVQNLFDLQSGRTILTAGVLLSLMILPSVITLVDDAIFGIPKQYKEAAYGLGLYRYELILNVLLPIAKPEIIGACLLALGRALGETMAVMLVIGSIDKIPTPIFNWLTPGQTITSKLGREVAESSFGSLHHSSLIFMGFFLLCVVMLLTLVAEKSFQLGERLHA